MPNLSKQGAAKSGKAAPMAIGAIILVFTILSGIAFYVFQKVTEETSFQISSAYIEELGVTLNSRIQSRSSYSWDELLLIANPLKVTQSEGHPVNLETVSSYLSLQCTSADMQFVGLLTKDGICYGSDGKVTKVVEPDYLAAQVTLGKTFLPVEDINKGYVALDGSLFYYIVAIDPLYSGDKEFIAIVGGLDSTAAERSLGNDVGSSEASIVTSDGYFVFYPEEYAPVAETGNLFDLLNEYATFAPGESASAIQAALDTQGSCLMQVELLGVKQFLYVTPLEQTNLFICIAMPIYGDGGGMNTLSTALFNTALLFIVCILILSALFTYLYARSLRKSRALLADEKERAEQASEEARSASRAKSDFLSRMSHEIRTPLSGVIGMTEIALRSVGDDTKTEESLRKIQISSKHLLSIINDILDMSKIESGKVEITNAPFDLRALLSSVDAVSSEQASEHSIAYQTIIDPEVEDYYIGDQLHLSQILYNLLSNALKFTSEGGSITLRIGITDCPAVRKTTEDREFVPMPIQEETVCLRFDVIDTGCGISEENLDKVFDAFEQENAYVAKNYGGTGLGLAITKRFAEMMGGNIGVSSIIGNGTTFTLVLPFGVIDSASQDREAALNTQRFSDLSVDSEGGYEGFDFSDKRILLVEDNELNREIGMELIGMSGAAVEVAANGEEAVMMFEQSSYGYYDLVLMDIQMPIMDGYEATKVIRTSKRPDAKTVVIIAMTANAFQEDVEQSLKSGMNDHISKPLDIRLVFTKIERAFKNEN